MNEKDDKQGLLVDEDDGQQQTQPQPPEQGTALKAGSMLDAALSRLSQEQIDALVSRAGDEALRLEARQRELNIDYVHNKKTLEDHVDAFNSLDMNGGLKRHSIVTEINSGHSSMRVESKSTATCFVATATYQDAGHPDVVYLRAWRDQVLQRTPLGRRAIDWYWQHGPGMARVVEAFPRLRRLSRLLIARLVKLLRRRYPL